MSNPVLAFIDKKFGPNFVPRLRQQARGLAADFWKDPPCTYPVVELRIKDRTIRFRNIFKPAPAGAPLGGRAAAGPHWHALAGEVAEKMWGEGYVLPAADQIMEQLLTPLNLTKEMGVLYLTAGLGTSLQKIIARAANVKGLEPMSALAMRGADLAKFSKKSYTVSSYDPANFQQPAEYDRAIARELFYRVGDKQKFFAAIAAALKPGGQISFTDYVVNPEDRAKPAILSWQAQEKHAAPLGLIDMAEMWAKAGFAIRDSEDMTPFYKHQIIGGLNRLVVFLGRSAKPDAETKRAILREVEMWVHRVGAVGQGMKFYRFYAVKS